MNHKKIYDRIIERAKSEQRIKSHEIYYESHHIIPKCLGGEGKTTEWKTHPNIVLLTAKEHFIVHLLLCEIYPNEKKLKFALWGMCNQDRNGKRYKVNSKKYEKIREEFSKLVSETYKGRPAHNKGKPNPKTALSKIGIPRPDLSERNRLRKGISKNLPEGYVSPLKGIKQSDELIKKRADARKKNGKCVLQFDLGGNFIKKHDCMTDAYNWMLENNIKGDIKSNLTNRTKKAGGFIWKYE
jgi:hypothetical protein